MPEFASPKSLYSIGKKKVICSKVYLWLLGEVRAGRVQQQAGTQRGYSAGQVDEAKFVD
jgi:hypothetical protein